MVYSKKSGLYTTNKCNQKHCSCFPPPPPRAALSQRQFGTQAPPPPVPVSRCSLRKGLGGQKRLETGAPLPGGGAEGHEGSLAALWARARESERASELRSGPRRLPPWAGAGSPVGALAGRCWPTGGGRACKGSAGNLVDRGAGPVQRLRPNVPFLCHHPRQTSR